MDWCIHVEQRLVRWNDATGRECLRRQCLECGRLVGSARPRSETKPDTPWADPDREANYLAARDAIKQAEREVNQAQYAAYLETPTWRLRRQKVLKRASGQCEGCRARPATQVHHLTYAHCGNELLFELVALCRDCHRLAHDLPDGEDASEG